MNETQPASPAPAEKPKRKHRVSHKKKDPPTAREREIVTNMARHGMPIVPDMCLMLSRGEHWIKNHFAAELRIGQTEKKIEIMNMLHTHVMGRPAEHDKDGKVIREEIKPNVTACIFASKTICGLRERDIHEHVGKDGGPIETSDLTSAKERLAALVTRAAESGRLQESSGAVN